MTTVSSDADNDFPAQVSELEKQLKSQIKEKRAFHRDVRSLCGKLREKYVEIILTEPGLSEKYDTATSLWHFVYYVMIDEFRTRLRYAATAAQRQKLVTDFRKFIAEATKFYSGLILKLKGKYGLPEEEGSEFGSRPDGKQLTEFKRTCHRFYIHLGDLARYKEVHSDGEDHSPDWSTPAGYYFQALSLWPAAGHPHNQLAVVATYMRNDFLAVYHYFRSLGVEDPFITARGNLVLLFERNRQQYSEISHKRPQKKGKEPPKQESEQDTKHNFFIRFVRLNGILFTKTSLETFSDVFLETVRDLEKLLSLDTTTLESVFSSELRKAEDSSKGLALGLLQLISILISSVPTGISRNSYADALQHTTISKYALTAAFKFAGCFMSSCAKSNDVAESALLPASLVFMEWLASRQELAAGASSDDEKQTKARAGFWKECLTLLNKICDAGDEEISSTLEAALWEDHELAGFTPLSSAQLGLNFNKKNCDEAVARTNRFVAAGKAIAAILDGSSAGIAFDEDMGRFFLAGEHREKRSKEKVVLSKVSDVQSKSVEPVLKPQVEAQPVPPPPPVEEDDEEVIVFQPVVKVPDSKSLGDMVKENDVGNGMKLPPTVSDLYSSLPNNDVSLGMKAAGIPAHNPLMATAADSSKLIDAYGVQNLYDPVRVPTPNNLYRSLGIADSIKQNDYGLPTDTEFSKCFGPTPSYSPHLGTLGYSVSVEPPPSYSTHFGSLGLPAAAEPAPSYAPHFYDPSSVNQTLATAGNGHLKDLTIPGADTYSYSSFAQDLLYKLQTLKEQQNVPVPVEKIKVAPPPEPLVSTAAEVNRGKLSSVRPPPGFGPIPQRASFNQKLVAPQATSKPLVDKEPSSNMSNWMDSFQSGRAAGQPLYGPSFGIWSNNNNNNNASNGIPASRSSAYPFPGMGVHTVQEIEQQLPSTTWKQADSSSAALSFEQPQQAQNQAQQPPFRPYRPHVS